MYAGKLVRNRVRCKHCVFIIFPSQSAALLVTSACDGEHFESSPLHLYQIKTVWLAGVHTGAVCRLICRLSEQCWNSLGHVIRVNGAQWMWEVSQSLGHAHTYERVTHRPAVALLLETISAQVAHCESLFPPGCEQSFILKVFSWVTAAPLPSC